MAAAGLVAPGAVDPALRTPDCRTLACRSDHSRGREPICFDVFQHAHKIGWAGIGKPACLLAASGGADAREESRTLRITCSARCGDPLYREMDSVFCHRFGRR